MNECVTGPTLSHLLQQLLINRADKPDLLNECIACSLYNAERSFLIIDKVPWSPLKANYPEATK